MLILPAAPEMVISEPLFCSTEIDLPLMVPSKTAPLENFRSRSLIVIAEGILTFAPPEAVSLSSVLKDTYAFKRLRLLSL